MKEDSILWIMFDYKCHFLHSLLAWNQQNTILSQLARVLIQLTLVMLTSDYLGMLHNTFSSVVHCTMSLGFNCCVFWWPLICKCLFLQVSSCDWGIIVVCVVNRLLLHSVSKISSGCRFSFFLLFSWYDYFSSVLICTVESSVFPPSL
jgi:hypothetical protein